MAKLGKKFNRESVMRERDDITDKLLPHIAGMSAEDKGIIAGFTLSLGVVDRHGPEELKKNARERIRTGINTSSVHYPVGHAFTQKELDGLKADYEKKYGPLDFLPQSMKTPKGLKTTLLTLGFNRGVNLWRESQYRAADIDATNRKAAAENEAVKVRFSRYLS